MIMFSFINFLFCLSLVTSTEKGKGQQGEEDTVEMPRRRETNMEELLKLKWITKVTNHYLTTASFK
jgi:hypothetical protein